MLNIKTVLDRFAQEKLCWRAAWFVRTSTGLCPLQVIAKDYNKPSYLVLVSNLGLDQEDIFAILDWADFGKWRIPRELRPSS